MIESLKVTDIGEMPESWEVVRIREITHTVYRYPTYYNIDYVSGGVPEIRGELLRPNGRIDTASENLRYISKATAEKFPRVRLEAGDIVMSVRGTMGKIGIVPQELAGGVITANLIRLAPHRDRIDPNYFRWVLQTSDFQRRLNSESPRTTIQTITAPVLTSLRLPLPPLPEQRAIAAVLSKIQAAIEVQQRIVATLKELKAATMAKLFREGTRGERLKQTEIGEMPESWEVVTVGKTCDIRGSTINFTSLNPNNLVGDHRVFAIKVSDMNLPGNETHIRSAGIEFFASSDYVAQYCIRSGSIAFPKRGAAISTNKKRLTQSPVILDPNLIGVSPKRVDSEYLFHWFLTFDIRRIQEPGAVPQLNKKNVEPVQYPRPSQEEQFEIANILGTIDKRIVSAMIRVPALQDLFSSMLHLLMTGQVRVNGLNLEDVSQ